MDLKVAEKALRFIDWEELLDEAEGTEFGLIVDGELVTAKVVSTEDVEDSSNDRNLAVVVEIRGQFFRKTGYKEIGSHCYGEYEASWYSLEVVNPVEKMITVYDAI
jgi:hypothetical protein